MLKLIKICAFLLLICTALFAEEPAGIIAGTVKRSTGALEGVTVAVLNTKKEIMYQTVTDKDGKYELNEVKGGLYTVKALPPKEMKLARQESSYVNVLSGKTSEINFSLREARKETLVFPKGFDEKNTNSPMNGLRIVQLGVDNNKTTNETKFGVSCHYPVGPAQGEASEGLIWFDLSSIQAGTQIISAKLSMRCMFHLQGANSIGLHRVLVNWNEKANWTTYDGVKEWQKPGGTGRKDIEIAANNYVEVPAGGDKMNAWFDWDITEMAQKWVDKEEPNYGMKTKTVKTASVAVFKSDIYNGTNFIKLTVVLAK